MPIFYNGHYVSNFFYLQTIFLVSCLTSCANVMSLLLMTLFCFQTSRDGVNRDVGETLPRLPGEIRITGKACEVRIFID